MRLSPLPGVGVLLLLLTAPLAAQGPDPVSQADRMIELRQAAEARRLLEPYVGAHPGDARAAYLLGRAHAQEERIDAAVEWLERAVRLDGGVSEYHYQLGVAYGLKARRASVIGQARLAGRARGALERAVALDGENLEARYGLVQFHLIAPRIMGGDRTEARRQAEEIQRRDPYRGALALGAVHGAENDFAAAAAEYEAVLAQYPDSAALVLALGSAYDRQGRPEAALPLYEALLRRRPDEMGVLYQVGRVGAITGQGLERSEEALRRYLRHRPGPGQPPVAAAHWRLGMVYEKQGRSDRARAEYEAALALDPRHEESREALKRLGG